MDRLALDSLDRIATSLMAHERLAEWQNALLERIAVALERRGAVAATALLDLTQIGGLPPKVTVPPPTLHPESPEDIVQEAWCDKEWATKRVRAGWVLLDGEPMGGFLVGRPRSVPPQKGTK